jgi:hypothetical protein
LKGSILSLILVAATSCYDQDKVLDKDFLASFQTKNDGGYIGLGKLIDGVVKIAAYSKNEKVIYLKNRLIGEIIKAQESDGYIGNMTPENRMWKPRANRWSRWKNLF